MNKYDVIIVGGGTAGCACAYIAGKLGLKTLLIEKNSFLGGSATVCLNASNEEAVFAFLRGQIKLFDIIDSVEKMMSQHKVQKSPNIDEIFAIDEEIRRKTRELF